MVYLSGFPMDVHEVEIVKFLQTFGRPVYFNFVREFGTAYFVLENYNVICLVDIFCFRIRFTLLLKLKF